MTQLTLTLTQRSALVVIAIAAIGLLTSPAMADIVVPVAANGSSQEDGAVGAGKENWHAYGPAVNMSAGLGTDGTSCCNDNPGFPGGGSGNGLLANGLMGFDLSSPQAAGLGGTANPNSLPRAVAAGSANGVFTNYPVLTNYNKGADTDDKPRSSFLSTHHGSAGDALNDWIEIELPQLTNLAEIWVYNWNDGEGREANRLDLDISADSTTGLVGSTLAAFGSPGAITWTSVKDDWDANDGGTGAAVGRQKGRTPDWVHTFAGGTQGRYLRLNEIANTGNNASTGFGDQVGLGGIIIFGTAVPEPSTALLLVAGLIGLVGGVRRRRR